MTPRTLTEAEVASFIAGGTGDEYRLRSLGFTPDVIYDIGADVGSMTLFAHGLWPEARIVAVEPFGPSYERLLRHVEGIPQITAIHAAIGKSPLWEPLVTTEQVPGFALHWLVVDVDSPIRRAWSSVGWVPSSVPAVTLSDLYAQYGGQQFIVKTDCEGAETAIMDDPASTEIVRQSAYFACELHGWNIGLGACPWGQATLGARMMAWLFDLANDRTMDCWIGGACIHAWSKRKDVT